MFDTEVVDVPVIVLLEPEVRDPLEDPVEVLEAVIDPVVVGVRPIVRLFFVDEEDDGEAVPVLDARTVAVSDVVALDVLVRRPDPVAVGELVPVFELLTDPVVVLDITGVLDMKELRVAVLDESCVSVY